MPAQTYLFPCLKDNFGVLIHDPESGATASIDAPEAAPVEAALAKDRLAADRYSGHPSSRRSHRRHRRAQSAITNAASSRRATRRSASRMSTRRSARATRCRSARSNGRVIETPGHTAGHISYFFPADKLAFVGDTLFSIGCGRVIEGNPEMMWQSLLKLRALPDDTQFYCGHEYTDANIRFAKTIEPNNKALAARAEEVTQLLAAGKPTIPATIGAEKADNPFLRADVPEVAQVGRSCRQPGLESVRGNPRAQKPVLTRSPL